MDTIKLKIDNREVEVPKGTTILNAAKQLGISIPTLCHFEFKGMDVHNRPGGCARRTVLELMLSDHPNDCLQCAKSGKCELQALAIRFGIRSNPFVGPDHAQSSYQIEVSPSIIRDMNKCVMCRRCEMMCNEMQTVGALSALRTVRGRLSCGRSYRSR